ncbi:MAG: RluA family pseudouridine synthase [Thermoanaerobaculia bacterium]
MRPNTTRVVAHIASHRLDTFISLSVSNCSRNKAKSLILEGYVIINGSVASKPSTPVRSGDVLEIRIPPPSPVIFTPRDIPVPIIYQDDDFAVVDKPAGLVVHPGAGNRDATLVHALLFHIKDLSGIGGELRPGIVHRLDKDTSGLLVVAKNDTAHRALTSQWNSAAVKKEYLALVYGSPRSASGTIEKPIGRDPRDRKKMNVVAGGRAAVTIYEVVETLRYASLLRCTLKSGRTHQIRVHLKALGHPIVGDPLYAGPQWKGIPDRKLQKIISAFPRQALHAARLSFPHPRSGEPMTFEAPLPEDFAALLAALR